MQAAGQGDPTRRRDGDRRGAWRSLVGFAVVAASLVAGGVAHAHRPHSVVMGVAVPGDFASVGRAWAIMDPSDVSQLMLTTDFGAHWDFAGGRPQEDRLVGIAYASSTLVLLGSDGSVWWTNNEGSSWGSAQLPDAVLGRGLATSGTRVVFATSGGLYRATAPNMVGFTRVATGDYVDVTASGSDTGTFTAVLATGRVAISTDAGASFSIRRALPAGVYPYTANVVNGRLVVGTRNGTWYLAADWTPCGTLPADPAGDYAFHVVRMTSTSGGKLLAGTGEQSMFVSDDRCGNWTFVDSGLDAHYGVAGGTSNAREAVTCLYSKDGHVVTAGWAGLFVSHDDGATFTWPKLIPADYVRALDFSPGYPDHPYLYVGGYGGGAWWTWNGGRTYDGSARGLLDEQVYTQDLVTAPDLETSGVVFLSADRDLYRSVDAGRSWVEEVTSLAQINALRSSGERVYILGRDDAGDGLVLYTDDAGDTYEEWTSLGVALAGRWATDVRPGTLLGTDAVVVATEYESAVIASWDGGLTFDTLWTGTAASDALVALWPIESPTRIALFDKEQGVLWSDDAGLTWNAPSLPPVGVRQAFHQADDGTMFFVDRAGRIQASEDGGDTWLPTGGAIAPAVFVMASSPDYAVTDTLLFGTYAGVYYTQDRGVTVRLLERFERMEQDTYHVECLVGGVHGDDHVSACTEYAANKEGQGGGYLLAEGDVIAFSFLGDGFTVLGARAGEGDIDVAVDGAWLTTLNATGGDLLVRSLPLGWHDVELTALPDPAGPGIHFDAIETDGGGTVLP